MGLEKAITPNPGPRLPFGKGRELFGGRMIISDEEARNLIEMMVAKYVPAGMDKINVLEKLHGLDRITLTPASLKCSKCGEEMVCLKCSTIDIDSDVTVRINGNIIYDN